MIDKIFQFFGDIFYNKICFYYLHLKKFKIPKKLDIINPRTFNEKIIWLKLHKNNESLGYLVDKVKVKEFVSSTIGEKYVIPTYKIFDDPNDITKSKLPKNFILKMNHGSGWNIICFDKNKFELTKSIKLLKKWKSLNYYKIGKELPYKNIIPKILCEELLGNKGGIVDYKFFCFNGQPKYIQVDYDRYKDHKRNFFSINWELLPFTTLYKMGNGNIKKPNALEEMLNISKILSKDLNFARVDLYFIENKIYFGEITLHHGGGFEPFIPSSFDLLLGNDLEIE